MCAECRTYPCHAACPNAEELPVAFVCGDCGDGIHVGDDYIRTRSGNCYCQTCAWEAEASFDDLDDGGDEAYEAQRDFRMEEAYT